MKKITAVLLALLLILSAALADGAEESALPAEGDWYASINGVSLRLSLLADGSYSLSSAAMAGEASRGSWELRDGIVWLDGATACLTLVSEELLIWSDASIFFSRQPAAAYAPAEIAEDAQLEWFSGYWRCAYLDVSGEAVPASSLGEDTDIVVRGNLVALGGELFGDVFWEFAFEGGAMTAAVGDDLSIAISYQQDGLLRMVVSAPDGDTTLYLSPAYSEALYGRTD